MNEYEARLVLIELMERAEKSAPLKAIKWDKFVSEEQNVIVEDPSKSKVLSCPRRKGKTVVGAVYLLRTAYEKQGSQCLYLALTRKSAKGIIWRTLKTVAHKYNIKAEFLDSELLIKVGTSHIYVLGADQEGVADRLRGRDFELIVIDEIGSFKSDIRYLIDDILTPTLLDHNGTMLIQGTPPPIWDDDDLFYEAWFKDKGWKKFTISKNPFIPHYDEWVEALRIKNGWSKDHPTYRREYLGEWVRDEESLVFKFDPGRNKYSQLPQDYKCEYVLGIDLGFNDATAFTVLAVYPAIKKIYCVECYQHTEMVVSSIANEVKLLNNKYHPVVSVADAGGGGKTTVEELNQIHHMMIKAADKANKKAYIEMFNSSLIGEQLLIHEHLIGLINELSTIQWDKRRKDIDSRFEDHRTHSALYAWREAVRFISPTDDEIKKIPTAYEDGYEQYVEQLAIDQYNAEKKEQEDLFETDENPYGIFEND